MHDCYIGHSFFKAGPKVLKKVMITDHVQSNYYNIRFQYCVMKGNTMNHVTSSMCTENGVLLIAHTKWEYEQRKLLTNKKQSSVTNH